MRGDFLYPGVEEGFVRRQEHDIVVCGARMYCDHPVGGDSTKSVVIVRHHDSEHFKTGLNIQKSFTQGTYSLTHNLYSMQTIVAVIADEEQYSLKKS